MPNFLNSAPVFPARTTLSAVALMAGLLGVAPTAAAAPPRQENLIFEIPGLPALAPSRTSWVVGRQAFVWVSGETFDISSVPWPEWDTKQVPVVLLPRVASTSVVFFNDAGQETSRIELEKSWAPHESDLPSDVSTFAIEIIVSERLRIRSDRYSLPKRQGYFECRAKVEDNGALEDSAQLKLCLEGLSGIQSGNGQWFVDMVKPNLANADDARFLRRTEKKLSAQLRRAKHAFRSMQSTGSEIVFLAGRTQVENLPVIGARVADLPDFQAWSPAPPSPGATLLHREELPSGTRLEVNALSTDAIHRRSMTSPLFGDRKQIFLQFVPAAGEARVRATDFPDYQTGLGGVLKPWRVQLESAFNSIASNRGEAASWLGLPGLELAVALPSSRWGGEARFSRDLVSLGSSLALTVIDVKTSYDLKWPAGLRPYAQLFGYSLSGRNPGSSRLGGAYSLGFGLAHDSRAMPWFWEATVGPLFTLGGEEIALGGQVRLQLNRMLSADNVEGWYAGSSISLGSYSAAIRNLVGIVEKYGELHIQAALAFGWAGGEFLGR